MLVRDGSGWILLHNDFYVDSSAISVKRPSSFLASVNSLITGFVFWFDELAAAAAAAAAADFTIVAGEKSAGVRLALLHLA
jgi:hypothetical protein